MGGSLSGIIYQDDPSLWRPPDPDDPDDVEGTYDAPSQRAVPTAPPEGARGADPPLSLVGPHARQGVMVGGTAGTVPSRTGDPGWGDQPFFFPPGVNGWTATAAQRDAERVARLAYLTEQAPLRDEVLGYEARGRERDRAMKVAQACGGPLPPPQGAIRGWGKVKPLFEYAGTPAGGMRQVGSAPLKPDPLSHCPETMVLVDPMRHIVLPGSFSARRPEQPPLPHPWNRGSKYDRYASGIDFDPGFSAQELIVMRRHARVHDARRARPYTSGSGT